MDTRWPGMAARESARLRRWVGHVRAAAGCVPDLGTSRTYHRTSRSSTSAGTKPTRTRAGPANGCRPSRSGKRRRPGIRWPAMRGDFPGVTGSRSAARHAGFRGCRCAAAGSGRRAAGRRLGIRRTAIGRRRVGVDLVDVSAVAGISGVSVPRVQRGLLRFGIPRAARRVLGQRAGGGPGNFPQLGLSDPPADLRGFSVRQGRRTDVCRHLAWLGPPRPLSALLLDPPHSLYRQSWAPRRQRHGTVNADGFGVGWYAAGRTEPVQFRRAQPIWTDRSFASLAPAVTSGCVRRRGTVRDAAATRRGVRRGAVPARPAVGSVQSQRGGRSRGNCSRPARLGPRRSPHGQRHARRAGEQPARLAALPLPDALAESVLRGCVPAGSICWPPTGRCVAATTWGDTLSWIRRDGGVLVASEPDDDDPAWIDVPDQVAADRFPAQLTVDVRPLEARDRAGGQPDSRLDVHVTPHGPAGDARTRRAELG